MSFVYVLPFWQINMFNLISKRFVYIFSCTCINIALYFTYYFWPYLVHYFSKELCSKHIIFITLTCLNNLKEFCSLCFKFFKSTLLLNILTIYDFLLRFALLLNYLCLYFILKFCNWTPNWSYWFCTFQFTQNPITLLSRRSTKKVLLTNKLA